MDTLSRTLTIILVVLVIVMMVNYEFEKQPIGEVLVSLSALAISGAAPSLLLLLFPALRRLGKDNAWARATEIVLLGVLDYVLIWGVLTWIGLQFNYALSCALLQHSGWICGEKPSLEQLVQELPLPLSRSTPQADPGDYLMSTAMLLLPPLITMTLVSLLTHPE